jgi:release factor glutamine methyltransferase
MTIGHFLNTATQQLKSAGIDSARLDCLVLLEDATSRDRTSLLAHPELEVDVLTEVWLNNKVAQRAAHTPLAYLRGHVAFYGRDFTVNHDVLVPRPETEVMIELLKTLPTTSIMHIIDVGTGSGCIGITAALELPTCPTTLIDIDEKALAIAKQNVERLHADNIQLRQNDLLLNYKSPCDIILANLPYVPDAYEINTAASHEPRLALFAGADGLDLYRKLWEQIAALQNKPVFVFTESLIPQHPTLTALAKASGYNLIQTKGLIQEFTRG